MSKDMDTTRRNFLKSGAIIAAPVAAIAVPAVAMADDGSKARLARLEDERAIEELNRSFQRSLNRAGPRKTAALFADGKAPKLAEGIRRLSLDLAEDSHGFEISEDGNRASARISCVMDVEHALEGEGTFVQMARLQGNSHVVSSENRIFAADYVRHGDGWAFERVQLA